MADFPPGKLKITLGLRQTKVLGCFEGMEIILFTTVIIGPADRTQWSQEPNTLDRVPKELLLRRKPNEANVQGVLACITTLKKEDRIDKLEVVKCGCRIGDKSRSG